MAFTCHFSTGGWLMAMEIGCCWSMHFERSCTTRPQVAASKPAATTSVSTNGDFGSATAPRMEAPSI